MTTNSIPAATHNDCSHNYGGAVGEKGLATITVAYFVIAGITHKAIRFWRHDYLKTGKVEIYTIESYDPSSSCTELGWNSSSAGDFLRYANENTPSRTDLAAMCAIAAADPTYHCAHVDQAARYAAMEL